MADILDTLPPARRDYYRGLLEAAEGDERRREIAGEGATEAVLGLLWPFAVPVNDPACVPETPAAGDALRPSKDFFGEGAGG